MNIVKEEPSPKSQQVLQILKTAVAHTLEKKKRLGQYAVVWENNQPVIIRDEALHQESPESDHLVS